MLKIAFNEILIKWKNTIVSAILFGVILTLVVAGISSYERVYSKYKPFKELLKQNGYIVSVDTTQADKSMTVDEIIERNVKAEKWYTAFEFNGNEEYNCIVTTENERISTAYDVIGYNDIIGGYIPDMKEGIWYTKAQSVKGQIEVVISSDTQGLKYGDYFYLEKLEDVKFHVCGVTKANTSYFVLHRFTRYSSIFDYYEKLSDRIDNKLEIFANYDDLAEYYTGKGLVKKAPVVFAVFNDDTKPDKGSNYGVYTLWDSFETMRKNTKQKINENLNEVIPVFIAIIILSVLSLICSVAIDVTFSLGNYASLYISGMKWKDIIYLNMIKVFFQAAIGFVLMFGIETYFKKIFGDMFIFSFGVNQIIGCIVVTLIVLLVTCIMPLIIIKTKSPADVLRESRIQ